MKNWIYFLLAILSCFVVSCQDDSMYHEITRPDDTMLLRVSAESIELNQELGREVAVTFAWNEVTNVEPDVKVTYYFKMDIADNNFLNSIDKIEIPSGSNSISFTHKKLNALLKSWKVTAGESATLEAEIIAEIEGGSHYVKPELSTVRFNVVGYEVQPYDIFIVGDAIDGLDPSKAVQMTEEIAEEKYVWNGVMKTGTYKFILSNTSLFPSYTQGAAQGSVVYNETETANETLFSVGKEGFYSLILNIETGTLEAVYPTTEYENVWMIGAATTAGWEIMNAVKLKKDPTNQVAFYYEGWLNAGEMKFPLELRPDWNIAAFMPIENGTNENGDNRMERIEAGGHDYKWNISKADNYRVTLNTYTMTIEFGKPERVIPDEVPYKTVWMLGDATPAGWDQGREPFTYDFDAMEKGTFYWEGELKAGTFKCPVNVDPSFQITSFMPSSVEEGEDWAPLTETNAVVVEPGEGIDHKWKVEENEAGDYRVELNVISNTIKFIRK